MADKKLFKARIDFINKVRYPILTQLLDHLLSDEVLNEQEKNSVLELNCSHSDKARLLIDMVRPKGNAASQIMIDHILALDKHLHKELFPTTAEAVQDTQMDQGGQPAPTPPDEYSDKLIPTTETFWRKQQLDEDVYPAFKNAIKKRVALLITNIEFREKKYNRSGADRDHGNMEILLSGLGYEVVKHTNLTAKEMDEALDNFSKHPRLRDTDSVIVVIMSHGKLGFVLGVNYRIDAPAGEEPDEFPLDNICKRLACPELEDKPKVVIIQACRGGEKGSRLVWDDEVLHQDSSTPAAGRHLEDDALQFVNEEKDFFFLLSSTPHMKSYRHPVHGSLLIQYVVDIFNTFAHQDHIEELCRKVSKRFEKFQSGDVKQMATRDRCSLTRRFFFYPGI